MRAIHATARWLLDNGVGQNITAGFIWAAAVGLYDHFVLKPARRMTAEIHQRLTRDREPQ